MRVQLRFLLGKTRGNIEIIEGDFPCLPRKGEVIEVDTFLPKNVFEELEYGFSGLGIFENPSWSKDEKGVYPYYYIECSDEEY